MTCGTTRGPDIALLGGQLYAIRGLARNCYGRGFSTAMVRGGHARRMFASRQPRLGPE